MFRCLHQMLPISLPTCTSLPTSSPTLIAQVFIALACYWSSVLCKWQLCYKFRSSFLAIYTCICYHVTPWLWRPTSVTRRRDTGSHRGFVANIRNRGSEGHTVASLGLHWECTDTNRSITGTHRQPSFSEDWTQHLLILHPRYVDPLDSF